MHKRTFAAPRASYADGASHNACSLGPACSDAVQGAVAGLTARLGRWAGNMIRAREILSRIPAEGDLCPQGDEVGCARQLLLGQNDSQSLTGT
jgi:hypothetical protein